MFILKRYYCYERNEREIFLSPFFFFFFPFGDNCQTGGSRRAVWEIISSKRKWMVYREKPVKRVRFRENRKKWEVKGRHRIYGSSERERERERESPEKMSLFWFVRLNLFLFLVLRFLLGSLLVCLRCLFLRLLYLRISYSSILWLNQNLEVSFHPVFKLYLFGIQLIVIDVARHCSQLQQSCFEQRFAWKVSTQ